MSGALVPDSDGVEMRCDSPVAPSLSPAIIPSFGADMRKLTLLLFLFATTNLFAQQYDLVLEGGRVIDPETSLDAVRNVGIRDGKIARISAAPLSGRRTIDVAGLVVAPGFIDLHQHGQGIASQRVKAFDGVTTALEMEIGVPNVAEFLKSKNGHSLIHYGTTASHLAARALVFGAPLPDGEILPKSGSATDQPATTEQIKQMQQHLRDELDAGALGVGMGIQYAPGATRLEVIDMFRVAAERKLPVYTHMRSAGRVEPGSAIESVEEVIGAAAITGAPLHIVHINSTCLRDSLGMPLSDRRSPRPGPRCDHRGLSLHCRHDSHQFGAYSIRGGARNWALTTTISSFPIPASTSPKSASTNCTIRASNSGCWYLRILRKRSTQSFPTHSS